MTKHDNKTIINNSFISERKSIRLVEPIINNLRKELDIPDEKFYNILISVTEAVNNAIIHGNKCCNSKKVNLDIYVENNIIKIIVEDEGLGFEPNKIADPRHPENLFKTGGRGVFLIKELSDKYDISSSECGSKIIMEFIL